MHCVFEPEYDQRSLEAFESLKLTPREAEVLFWISRGKSNHGYWRHSRRKDRHHLQAR
jgi:DNA-binding NarL/FixJ family response regulator